MYRLLIVDDEPIIVDGLKNLFQEIQHLSLEVMGAYSSQEALQWLMRTRVDIVLCDIEMPGMNGIELHHKILNQWPSCKVIFLSGHDDFSYIQEAIRNHSVDYVLKTEGDAAILEALEKAIDHIVRDRNVYNVINSANQKMHMAMPFLRQELLVGLLNGESLPIPALENRFTSLEIPLCPSARVLLIVAQLDDWNMRTSVQERSNQMFAVQNIAEECLTASVKLVSTVFERNIIVWFIQPTELSDSDGQSKDPWARSIRFVYGTLETIQEICLNYVNESVSFVAADDAVDWIGVSERFKALKRVMLNGTVVSRQLLLTESNFPTTKREQEDSIKQEWLERNVNLLKAYLMAGQRQEFYQIYLGITEARHNLALDDHVQQELYFSLVSIYLICLNRWGIRSDIETEFDLWSLTRIESHVSWEAAVEYLHQLADIIMRKIVSFSDGKRQDVIHRIQTYIEQNLAGDLSLTRLGEIVCLNPAYLSRLYKQVTGVGLLEYTNTMRLEKAKQLLAEETWKIQDIASEVGFSTAAYFTRFFKKMVNITPNEYRESVRQQR